MSYSICTENRDNCISMDQFLHGNEGEAVPLDSPNSPKSLSGYEDAYEESNESNHKDNQIETKASKEITVSEGGNNQPRRRKSKTLPSNRFHRLYSNAKEMEMKKNEKREILNSQYTFKPKLSKKSRQLSAKSMTEATPRYENLYKNAITKEERLLKVKKEMEEKEKQQCSFKPNLISTNRKSQQKSELYNIEKEKEKKELLEKARIEQELANCTFKPNIAAMKKKGMKKKDDDVIPFHERLYKEAELKKKLLEQKQREQEEKEKAELPFKPMVSATTTTENSSKEPLHERLYMEAKTKKALLEQKIKEKEEQELAELSFKPTVSVTSENLTSSNKEPLHERLYMEAKTKKAMLEQKIREKEEQEIAELPFKPTVSTGVMKETNDKVPLHERLYLEAKQKKEQLEQRMREKEEEEKAELPFKPNVAPPPPPAPSTVIRKPSNERMVEKNENKSKIKKTPSAKGSTIFDRLYQEKDKKIEKLEELDQLKAQRELESCTFKPNIANVSIEEVGRKESNALPFWERLGQDKNQKLKELDEKKEKSDLEGCTFRPEISCMSREINKQRQKRSSPRNHGESNESIKALDSDTMDDSNTGVSQDNSSTKPSSSPRNPSSDTVKTVTIDLKDLSLDDAKVMLERNDSFMRGLMNQQDDTNMQAQQGDQPDISVMDNPKGEESPKQA